jgi:ribosomal protein L37E
MYEHICKKCGKRFSSMMLRKKICARCLMPKSQFRVGYPERDEEKLSHYTAGGRLKPEYR